MNTKMLLKEFRNILSYEERAKNFYDHYISQVEDEKVREQLISIRDDEIKHVGIAEKLIKFVS